MMNRLPEKLTIAAILIYRRVFSPIKGFRCAHHALHGEGSCSDYALNVFRKGEVAYAWAEFRSRLKACRIAAQTLASMTHQSSVSDKASKDKKKSSWCDSFTGVDCGGCDLSF